MAGLGRFRHAWAPAFLATAWAAPGTAPARGAPAAEPGSYTCESNWKIETVRESERKGICMDDTTFQECAAKIPTAWPHTDVPIKNLRVFKAWDDDFEHPPEERGPAHDAIAEWARATGSKVLVGVQITCNKDQNLRQWGWTKELLEKLGPESVMGLAIGNEMDLYELKDHNQWGITSECIDELWGYGQEDHGERSSYFYRMFDDWVKDMDTTLPGFAKAAVPITTVVSGFSMASRDGTPFVNGDPNVDFYDTGYHGHLMINDLLTNLTKKFGSRFAWSLNIYPYFDDGANYLDPGCFDRCRQTVFTDLCFGNGTDKWGNFNCKFLGTAARFRGAVSRLTNKLDDTFWVTEFGWSYPVATTLKWPMNGCEDFTSQESFVTAYQGFLQWDMDMQGLEPPSQIFYFTVRDSKNFGWRESFGLIKSCEDEKCKLQCDGTACPEPFCWAKPETLGELDCLPVPFCQWPDWAAPIWFGVWHHPILSGILSVVILVILIVACICRCCVRRRKQAPDAHMAYTAMSS